MATEQQSGTGNVERSGRRRVADDQETASGAGVADSPMAHQGSGGPGDDRQDNSSASRLSETDANPESTPGTDRHQGGSHGVEN